MKSLSSFYGNLPRPVLVVTVLSLVPIILAVVGILIGNNVLWIAGLVLLAILTVIRMVMLLRQGRRS